ncbi:MAG: hypothetical protein BWY11_01932 [Firmicutes bacterium ADurb.Bin182]|nr:MAG: hypothetical protein BWY11_01932 [Firmicutes bacterium ADurb.Bin182]
MVERVIKNLKSRGFIAEYVQTGEEARKRALELIGSASCGFGGSVTVRDLRIYDSLLENGNELYWHWTVPDEKRNETRKKAMQADFYIASANAVSEDGLIVNTDGTGNRTASMFYGPRNVIIIAGVNKLVPDLEAALKRIRDIASPMNAKRLGLKTPCAKTGCSDCSSANRICRITTIMEAPSTHTENVYVIIVGQELGY